MHAGTHSVAVPMSASARRCTAHCTRQVVSDHGRRGPRNSSILRTNAKQLVMMVADASVVAAATAVGMAATAVETAAVTAAAMMVGVAEAAQAVEVTVAATAAVAMETAVADAGWVATLVAAQAISMAVSMEVLTVAMTAREGSTY